MRRILEDLFAALAVAGLAAILWWLMPAPAAPVPPPRPAKKKVEAKPTFILGTHESKWGEWGSEMHFAPDGSYYHQYPGLTGARYVGTWVLIGVNAIEVKEALQDRQTGALGNPVTWQVEVKPDGTGWSGGATGGYGNVEWGLRPGKP